MTTDSRTMYTPVERAVLAKYFRLKDPQPRDLVGIDVSTPVDPDEWDEASQGIAPLPSDIYEDFMLQNAVARICLKAIQKSLPHERSRVAVQPAAGEWVFAISLPSTGQPAVRLQLA